jgi:group I intron endonuclease
MNKTSGIYKIINKVNGKYYVGSSNDIRCRWSGHKKQLKRNNHNNPHLQFSWNKYGPDNFEFVIVEETPEDKLVEQHYLDIAKNEKEKCYNTSFIVGYPPKLNEEQEKAKREKISKSIKKCWNDKEYRLKCVGSRISYLSNDENRKKNGEAVKRGWDNPITRKRMSERRKDKTIYKFYNIKTNETFSGIRLDFILKYNLDNGSVWSIIHGKRKSAGGWTLV